MDADELALEAKFTAILRETTSLTATDDEWIASAAKVLCRIAVEHYANALDAAESEANRLREGIDAALRYHHRARDAGGGLAQDLSVLLAGERMPG